MALGRVSDLRKSSFLLSKGCAAFRGRGHRRHERHAEARPTCHLCSFSDSLLEDNNLIALAKMPSTPLSENLPKIKLWEFFYGEWRALGHESPSLEES